MGTAAQAQDLPEGEASYGSATITLGGGAAFLSLPDVPSQMTVTQNVAPLNLISTFDNSSDFEAEIGENLSLELEVPMPDNGYFVAGGFYQAFSQDSDNVCISPDFRVACAYQALFDAGPTTMESNRIASITARRGLQQNGSRGVDHYGVEVAYRHASDFNVSALAQLVLDIGLDYRRIAQDLADTAITLVNGVPVGAPVYNYSETLDTDYVGLFAGANLPLPDVPLGGSSGPVLSTTLNARGGVYFARTDYDGAMTFDGGTPQALSLSKDNGAFIGKIGFESGVEVAQGIHFSLEGNLEYYSYVPAMAYNQVDVHFIGSFTENPNGQNGTVINSDDAFGGSLSLKMTIDLSGSQ